MDGKYVSYYPISKQYATLSTLTYTPVAKFDTLKKYKNFLNRGNFFKYLEKNSKKIVNDCKKFVILNKLKIYKITYAPKVKIKKDKNDQRDVEIRKERKLISVLCGKLDAVYILWKNWKNN